MATIRFTDTTPTIACPKCGEEVYAHMLSQHDAKDHAPEPFEMMFFINYGGRGYRLAMTGGPMDMEQAELLKPVEGCISIILPTGMKIDVPALEAVINRNLEVDTSFE